MWVKVEEYNRVVSELHALRTRSSTGLTCPHGTIGYCEPCALVDPGELGETPPRLVHSSTGEPPQDWQDIFTEYARYGRSDAWLYQQIEAHSRRATRSAIALPVMELRAAALGLLQAWNKSEREGISVAEMAKARQRVDAAIRATAPSHTAPEAVESFTVEVCDALFGCFVCPAEEDMFRCACCDWPIPITGWIHADHDEGCLIPRVRAYLAQHKPEAVPSPQRYETKEKP